MMDYKNLSGNSSVKSFEIGSDFIIAEFKKVNKEGYSKYKYSYKSSGQHNVEQMKILAIEGKGLNSFISREVRKLYEAKW